MSPGPYDSRSLAASQYYSPAPSDGRRTPFSPSYPPSPTFSELGGGGGIGADPEGKLWSASRRSEMGHRTELPAGYVSRNPTVMSGRSGRSGLSSSGRRSELSRYKSGMSSTSDQSGYRSELSGHTMARSELEHIPELAAHRTELPADEIRYEMPTESSPPQHLPSPMRDLLEKSSGHR